MTDQAQLRPIGLQDRVTAQAAITKALTSAHRRRWWERVLGRWPIPAEDRSWYRGALGELAVGRILAALGPRWCVLHSLPGATADSDIDHVLIGPAGVYTLNTTSHPGRPRVQQLRHAAGEARRASRLLSVAVGGPVTVKSVIVVDRPERLAVEEPPLGVTVLAGRDLLRWLLRRRTVLRPTEVAEIVAAADRPETWQGHTAGQVDPPALEAAWTSLDREVREARHVRLVWGAVLLGCLVAVPVIALLR